MYCLKNDKLINENRIEINRNEIFNNTIDMFYKLYNKIYFANVIYLHFYILEINCISNNFIKDKFFIVCKNKKDMQNLRHDFENFKN